MNRSILRLLVGCAALSLPAPAQTVLFSESFENGLANWSATGLWHLVDTGDACGGLVAPFPEGSYCAYYGIPGVCSYNTGTTNSGELTLLTPIVLPATGPGLRLYCWDRHETEGCLEGYDVYRVQISTNGGTSWISVGYGCLGKAGPYDVWAERGIDLHAYLGQSILLRFAFDTLDDQLNDFRGIFVDKVELRVEAGQPFCASTCPCGGPFNLPSIGYGGFSGCTNSQTHFGTLAGGGTPSVANDTVVLTANAMTTRSVALFLQSDGQNNGAFDGDGRFCLTGTPLRLGARLAPLGTASLPGPGEPPLSVLGGVPPAGATRYYQVVYRDPSSTWCTSATFNHTNGYTITWTP